MSKEERFLATRGNASISLEHHDKYTWLLVVFSLFCSFLYVYTWAAIGLCILFLFFSPLKKSLFVGEVDTFSSSEEAQKIKKKEGRSMLIVEAFLSRVYYPLYFHACLGGVLQSGYYPLYFHAYLGGVLQSGYYPLYFFASTRSLLFLVARYIQAGSRDE